MEMTSVRLKRVREHLGLNQGGIAKKGGTIQSTWSNWEGGKLPEAFEVLKQLSTTYDLSTDYLLGLVDEPQGRVAGLSEAEERLLGLLRLLGPFPPYLRRALYPQWRRRTHLAFDVRP